MHSHCFKCEHEDLPVKCLEVMNEAVDWSDRDTNSHFTVLGSHQEAGIEGRTHYAI